MAQEENKNVIKRFYHEVWNKFDLSVVDELFSPDYIFNDLPSWRKQGSQDLKEFVADNHRMFPDVYHTVDDLIAEGDKVAYRFTGTETHKAELYGPLGIIPPTNKKVTWKGNGIARFNNGKIVEVWVITNNIDLMKQLGALPA